MFNTILNTPPFNLISEYITGWTIIIFIIFIIYFVALRKYYFNKEKFYYSNINDTDETDEIDETEETEDTEETEEIEDTKDTNIVENFVNSIISTDAKSTSQLSVPANIINTTLFDNLKLLPEQIIKCKQEYTNVVLNYINEFTKLLKLIKNNKFLNVDNQINTIITKGVDTIIYFLSNDIKSMNILTRTSIKTDLINITSNTIDYLVNKENIKLTTEINDLAKLNSTTIDYTSMVKNIDASRHKIEEYIEIDNLLSKYDQSNTNLQSKQNTVLDKSFILPIYERNFDRIKQLVNSDFNDNYTKLTEKYGQAYTDYLKQKKKEDLNVNPLEMLSKIESGVVNFLTNINDNKQNKTNNSNNTDLIEQYNADFGYLNNTINQVKHNPLPKQNKKLVNNTILNKNNIYENSSNLGNYLINNDTQKDILEGFVENTTKPKTTKPKSTKPVIITTKPNINNKNKIENENTSIIAKLFSGDFLQYIMDILNDKLNIFYTTYYKQFDNFYETNNSNNSNTKLKLDENLIPAGFLLFILSMLFYFIDLTS